MKTKSFLIFSLPTKQDSGMEDISEGEDDLSDFEFDLDDYSPSSFFNDVEVSSVFFSVVEAVLIIPSQNKPQGYS